MAGRRPLAAKRRAAGFSLIELLVVIAIGLVLLAMVAPAMNSNEEASSDVRRIVSDAAQARSWARTTWQTATLDIDAANRRWRIIDESGAVLDASSADLNGWRSLSTGVEFSAVAGTASDFGFESDGRGTEDAAVQVVAGDQAWSISMSALTGSVTAEAL